PPDHPGHAGLPLDVLHHVGGDLPNDLILRGGRPPDTVVVAGDLDAAPLILEGAEGPDQAERGPLEDGAEHRMEIDRRGPGLQLEVADPLHPADDMLALLGIALAVLPDAGVRPEKIAVGAGDRPQVGAADLLLPFDEKLHPAGEPAPNGPER